jgi:hypothetical protein
MRSGPVKRDSTNGGRAMTVIRTSDYREFSTDIPYQDVVNLVRDVYDDGNFMFGVTVLIPKTDGPEIVDIETHAMIAIKHVVAIINDAV